MSRDEKNNPGNKTGPTEEVPAEVVKNPNPKANENIRVRTDEPEAQNNESAMGVGTEITDGEDG